MVINIIVLDAHRNLHLWNDEGSDIHAKLYLKFDLNVSCSLVSINFWFWTRLKVTFVLWRKTDNFLSIEDMEIDYKLVLHARRKLCFDIWKMNEVQWTDSCLNRMTRWSLTTWSYFPGKGRNKTRNQRPETGTKIRNQILSAENGY